MGDKLLECVVEDEDRGYEERVICITDYTYKDGYEGVIDRAPEDCYPGESPTVEDIEARWMDGAPLTDKEHATYLESMIETIFEVEREVVHD